MCVRESHRAVEQAAKVVHIIYVQTYTSTYIYIYNSKSGKTVSKELNEKSRALN